MDVLYTYSYDKLSGKVKVKTYPVIRETDLTCTIENLFGQEVRIRKNQIGVLDSTRVMHLDRDDNAYYLRALIDEQRHRIMTLIGMIHNEAERLEKMEEALEEAENDDER